MNIVITGASKGLGKEMALAFSKRGSSKLFLISRDKKKLEDIKAQCLKDGNHCDVFILPYDLGNAKDMSDMAQIILKEAGEIDILINNAGTLINKKFLDISESEAKSMFTVNFFAPAALIRYLMPGLLNAKKAHVVNIGSMGGFQGSSKFPGLSYYSASKAALAVLTECLAEEFKSSGISFNCLAPGAFQTEMFSEAFPGIKAPVSASEMADFVVNFSLSAHLIMNGKIIPLSLSDPE